MKLKLLSILLLFLVLIVSLPIKAVVKYDEGRLHVDGVQLLQDNQDSTAYYYIPQYPRLATKDDGTLEFTCIKYVGKGGSDANGGIFHALIEFTLPLETIEILEAELKKKVPGGKIVGPVPLRQVMKDGEDGLASFKVVSSILNNTGGENPFTHNVITSGHAPLLPNSKAAIAAKLSQEGTTLLWESLQGPTSDVSVAISGYYEAAVKGYNAVITAEVNTVYEHMSRVLSLQEGYSKRQLQNVTDELLQEQVLNINVFDRSESLGIKTGDMEGVLSLVTDKLIELMFDAKTGWSKEPEKVAAVERNQIEGRQQRGWFSKVFGGARNEKYVTDDQFVMKNIEDIRSRKFYLNLSKSTTIKVPIYTSGNIGGIYNEDEEDEKYFKVVNLDDSDYQKRDVHFQVDGQFAESFKDIINFVTVSFRKQYQNDQDDVTSDLVFKRLDLEAGDDAKVIGYPRLGIENDDWLNYEYRVSWSLKGNDKTMVLPDEKSWMRSKEPAISLSPPLDKRLIEIDADRSFFKDAGIRSATVRFFVILNGKAQPQKTLVLKDLDAENSTRTALYHDKGEPVMYQVNWYSASGKIPGEPEELKDEYLFLIPPSNQ